MPLWESIGIVVLKKKQTNQPKLCLPPPTPKWLTTTGQAVNSTPPAENDLQTQQCERKHSLFELHPVCLTLRKVSFIMA